MITLARCVRVSNVVAIISGVPGRGCHGCAYNDAVRARRDAHAEGRPYPSLSLLSRALLTEAKRRPERTWLGEVSAVVLQQSLRDAEQAYRNFFASLKGERKGPKIEEPRMKSRKDKRAAIPVYRKRPLVRHPRWPPEPAEDRRGEGRLVQAAARRPVQRHRDQRQCRAVLRVLRH